MKRILYSDKKTSTVMETAIDALSSDLDGACTPDLRRDCERDKACEPCPQCRKIIIEIRGVKGC